MTDYSPLAQYKKYTNTLPLVVRDSNITIRNQRKDSRSKRQISVESNSSKDEEKLSYSTDLGYPKGYATAIDKWAMAKNGSSWCFLGQKQEYLKIIAAESVVGHIWLANFHFCGRGRSSKYAAGGCQSESYPEILRAQ